MSNYFVVDAHEDIAFNFSSSHKDFLKDIQSLRQSDPGSKESGTTATVSLPELQKGNVRLVFATLWVAPCGTELPASELPCYSTPDEAHAQAANQLKVLRGTREIRTHQNNQDADTTQRSHGV